MAQAKTLRAKLQIETLESRELLSTSPLNPAGAISQETFQAASSRALPVSWDQWTNNAPFAVSTEQAASNTTGLIADGQSGQIARAWSNQKLSADVRATVLVYSDSLIPGQLIVRASNLDTATPSYYSLDLTRGLTLKLSRVVNGSATTLGQIQSNGYLSNKWIQITLQAVGTTLKAQAYRTDTHQYLNSSGNWQSAQTWALTRTDSTISGGGYVGVGRAASYAGNVNFDDLEVVSAGTSTQTLLLRQTFDSTPIGALPINWSQWTNQGVFGASAVRALQSTQSLAATAASGQDARAWLNALQASDIQAGSAIFLDSLIPGQVFVRGANLDSATASYYAVSVTRGVQAQLIKVANGVTTTLGSVTSKDYLSGQWVVATVSAVGTTIKAQIYRPDTNQYLNSAGVWQSTSTWAIVRSDATLRGIGKVGLARGASYQGTISFDDFIVVQPASSTTTKPPPVSQPQGSTSGSRPGTPADTQPPSVVISSPGARSVLYQPTIVHANASDNVGVVRVNFLLDGVLQESDLASPYDYVLDPRAIAQGTHQITVQAFDKAGNVGASTISVNTYQHLPTPSTTTIPQHYSWIRIAELAYGGTPFGSFEQNLLRNSVDLVIPNSSYLDDIHQVAPNTPQLIYSNVSSLYQDLMTNWLSYADAHGISRESAFYHVNQATAFSGTSSSSQPVNWFWGVYTGGQGVGYTDYTTTAHLTNYNSIPLAGAGTSVYIGYPEKFREINISLAKGASQGWKGVLEYASSVDAEGNPTGWTTLKTLSDTTLGLARSGQILFDPPANWKAASINGTNPLMYVRIRTVSDGVAPIIRTVLGRDYVNANGRTSGVIPAFDYAADTNHDGYLSDAEYTHRRPGMNARFVYESRALNGYGQERPPTNPASAGFRAWSVDYTKRFLQANPKAAGIFMDNSGGRLPLDSTHVLEATSTYSTDYGTLLKAITQAVAPHFIVANTAGGQSNADGVVRQGISYYEEFGIRPLAQNYAQFEELAQQVAHRTAIQGANGYAILDSLSRNGSPTDPRTQIATLASYYLMADPNRTFLDFYGGSEPSTSWTQHWSQAVTYNVGLPKGSWSLFASGTDPSNHTLTYKVYQRTYTNALVLYKPLSYSQGFAGNVSLASDSATVHYLNGTYRPLKADGTLGAPVTRITLRNGEGAILIKV